MVDAVPLIPLDQDPRYRAWVAGGKRGPINLGTVSYDGGQSGPAAAQPQSGGNPLDEFSVPVSAASTSWGSKGANPLDEFSVPVDATKPQVGVVEDSLKGAGSGIVQGVEGLAGLPGDIQSGIGWAAGKVAGLVGASPETQAEVQSRAGNFPIIGGHLPTSEDVAAGVKNVTGFEPYKAQTGFGKFAQSAAEFIPGAVAMGPGGIVKNAAKNALKYGVLPGVASEAAGEATAGTSLEPVARVAGALAGGGLTGAKDALTARKSAFASVPTTDALKAQSQALYKSAENKGVVIAPHAWSGAVSDIKQSVSNLGIDPTIHPKATAALNRIVDTAGGAPTLKEVDTLRQVIGHAAKSIEPADKMMAQVMIGKLDDFLNRLNAGSVTASRGSPEAAVNILKSARSLWARQSKSAIIEEMMHSAETKAANYSASGLENAIRAEFRRLATNARRMARFSPEERKAIEYVARGGKLENALRMIGKFAPHGVVSSTLSAGAGFAAAGPIGAAATLATGELGRLAATTLTKDAAKRAAAIMRAGGKVPAALKQSLPQTAAKAIGRSVVIEDQNSRVRGATALPSRAR